MWYDTSVSEWSTSPWRWTQEGPPKRWYSTTILHGVRTQKISTLLFVSVRCVHVQSKRLFYLKADQLLPAVILGINPKQITAYGKTQPRQGHWHQLIPMLPQFNGTGRWRISSWLEYMIKFSWSVLKCLIIIYLIVMEDPSGFLTSCDAETRKYCIPSILIRIHSLRDFVLAK
jgi:hypothetical protein